MLHRHMADLVALRTSDTELKSLADVEIDLLCAKCGILDATIHELLTASPCEQQSEANLEIRAGEGGGEAALFAQDILGMYTRYATAMGYGFALQEVCAVI